MDECAVFTHGSVALTAGASEGVPGPEGAFIDGAVRHGAWRVRDDLRVEEESVSISDGGTSHTHAHAHLRVSDT